MREVEHKMCLLAIRAGKLRYERHNEAGQRSKCRVEAWMFADWFNNSFAVHPCSVPPCVLTPDRGRANALQLQHLYVGISTSLREVKVPGPAANFSIGSDSLGRTGSYSPLFCLVAPSSPPSYQYDTTRTTMITARDQNSRSLLPFWPRRGRLRPVMVEASGNGNG